jgi:hypothetical protein
MPRISESASFPYLKKLFSLNSRSFQGVLVSFPELKEFSRALNKIIKFKEFSRNSRRHGNHGY